MIRIAKFTVKKERNIHTQRKRKRKEKERKRKSQNSTHCFFKDKKERKSRRNETRDDES